MNRRGFLKAMLAASAAPAIVKTESLMKIIVPKQELILPNSLISPSVQIGDMYFSTAGDLNIYTYTTTEWKLVDDIDVKSSSVFNDQLPFGIHLYPGATPNIKNTSYYDDPLIRFIVG